MVIANQLMRRRMKSHRARIKVKITECEEDVWKGERPQRRDGEFGAVGQRRGGQGVLATLASDPAIGISWRNGVVRIWHSRGD